MWTKYFHQYLENQFPAFLKEKPWNYKDDLCVVGAYDLYEATGEEAYLPPILAAAPYLLQEDGSVTGVKPGEHNIDKVSFGKSLQVLETLTGEKAYKDAWEGIYESLRDYPRTKSGNFWHKDIYPNQVWLDGLYMGQPFYASCLVKRAEEGWDDILDQFAQAERLLWNENLGLYMHAWDESRQMEWADPVAGQSPCVWLRAEGWFLMALCDVYELAKEKTPRAGELSVILKKAVDGLLPYRQENGLFLQLVNETELAGNYAETSGSAMAAYALLKGSRLGMLPASYGETGADILDCLEREYLKQEEDGIHLYGICASAGLGPGPDNRTDRDGSPAYYLSEKQMRDNQHGAGACMMAAAEKIRRERA